MDYMTSVADFGFPVFDAMVTRLRW